MKKYFSGLTKNTFLLSFTSMFADISTEMLYPILPIFLTTVLGAGGAVVGVVEGVAVASQNIIQGISGAYSDKIQKRKPIAVFGYILAALSKPFIGLSISWWGVFAARSVDRLGSGIRSAPRDALVANSAQEGHRGKAFGLEGIGDNIGAFFGPLITVLLLYYFKVDMRNIFYLAVIPGLLAVVMVLFVKESKTRSSSFKAKQKLDINVFKFPKKYLVYLGVIFIFGIGNLSASFMILQAKNIGMPGMTTILTYALFNLVAALVSYPAGILSDRFGRKNLLLLSFAIFFFSLLGFTGTASFGVMIMLFAMYGVFMGIFRAAGKAFASDFVHADLRASSVGWYNTTIGISGLISGIAAGQIYDKLGPTMVFATSTIFVFIAFMAMLFIVQE